MNIVMIALSVFGLSHFAGADDPKPRPAFWSQTWESLTSDLAAQIGDGLRTIESTGRTVDRERLVEIGRTLARINLLAQEALRRDGDNVRAPFSETIDDIFKFAFSAHSSSPKTLGARRVFLESVKTQAFDEIVLANNDKMRDQWANSLPGRLTEFSQRLGGAAVVTAIAAILARYVDPHATTQAYALIAGSGFATAGLMWLIRDYVPWTRRFRVDENLVGKIVPTCADRLIEKARKSSSAARTRDGRRFDRMGRRERPFGTY